MKQKSQEDFNFKVNLIIKLKLLIEETTYKDGMNSMGGLLSKTLKIGGYMLRVMTGDF